MFPQMVCCSGWCAPGCVLLCGGLCLLRGWIRSTFGKYLCSFAGRQKTSCVLVRLISEKNAVQLGGTARAHSRRHRYLPIHWTMARRQRLRRLRALPGLHQALKRQPLVRRNCTVGLPACRLIWWQLNLIDILIALSLSLTFESRRGDPVGRAAGGSPSWCSARECCSAHSSWRTAHPPLLRAPCSREQRQPTRQHDSGTARSKTPVLESVLVFEAFRIRGPPQSLPCFFIHRSSHPAQRAGRSLGECREDRTFQSGSQKACRWSLVARSVDRSFQTPVTFVN